MTTKEKMIFLYEHSIPLTEFARRLKCNKTTLSRWLRGETNLSFRLEEALNKEIDNYLSELDIIRE